MPRPSVTLFLVALLTFKFKPAFAAAVAALDEAGFLATTFVLNLFTTEFDLRPFNLYSFSVTLLSKSAGSCFASSSTICICLYAVSDNSEP